MKEKQAAVQKQGEYPALALLQLVGDRIRCPSFSSMDSKRSGRRTGREFIFAWYEKLLISTGVLVMLWGPWLWALVGNIRLANALLVLSGGILGGDLTEDAAALRARLSERLEDADGGHFWRC